MLNWFGMTGTAGVIQGMIIVDTPGGCVFVTHIAGTRVMSYGSDMAGTTITRHIVIVINFTPVLGIMAILA